MNSTVRYYWELLRFSYWFLPALLGVAAIVLASTAVAIDRTIQEPTSWTAAWTYSGGPEGARAVLATIAGSMITVAGVVFSITIVALSQASAEFGPRLLCNFIRDRPNQFVLGTFTATFLYCLLVLRTVRGMDGEQFVPGISVTLGIVLAIGNLGVLIYFIHHVAISIQATHVIQSVSQELRETIDRLWPQKLGEAPEAPPSGQPPFREEESVAVASDASGYVDAIKDDALIELAQERDLIIQLTYRAGHFAVEGTPLARVWPQHRVDDDVVRHMNHAFVLAPQRTPFQDVEFAINQLVEVAVRALSPGVNDPFTARDCIDRLGEALCRLAQRSLPSPLRYDADNRLRVITYPADFAAVTDAAFHPIRRYGASTPSVLICLLETIAVVARFTRRNGDRAALARHAELVIRAAKRELPEEADLAEVQERFEAVQNALATSPAPAALLSRNQP